MVDHLFAGLRALQRCGRRLPSFQARWAAAFTFALASFELGRFFSEGFDLINALLAQNFLDTFDRVALCVQQMADAAQQNHVLSLVLKEGMTHLPVRYELPYAIARLTADLRKNQHADHYEASQWYSKALALRPTYRFLYRASVYELAKAPGHEQEAWKLLLEMFNSGPVKDSKSDRTNTGMTLMVTLFPKIKALQPDTVLPAELAAEAARILKEEALRQEKAKIQKAREESEIKAMEEEVLRKKQK